MTAELAFLVAAHSSDSDEEHRLAAVKLLATLMWTCDCFRQVREQGEQFRLLLS